MQIIKQPFGSLADGSAVTAWTLISDDGLRAEILDYGVTIRSLTVPDRDGTPVDVVLGYDTLDEYVQNRGYVGATIGRFANRIGGASFSLNGETYTLAANDGVNHLHGGEQGFDKRIWETETDIRFSLTSPDGEEGYPGTLQVTVTVSWQGRGLEFRYHAETDRDTILNLTNHSYFNLDGQGTVYDQLLQLGADSFCMGGPGCLPTGEIVPVAGTAMDFRTERRIGDAVDSGEPCVKLSGGYDSNFVLSSSPAAVARSEKTGIVMTVTTDQPGVQFYSANFLTPCTGKGGAQYGLRSAFCLETQHYPDCIHHSDWPTCILRAGESFDSFTCFEFSVRQ